MRNEMIARARRMGLALSDAAAEKFETYHRMLTEANAQFNLTRVPDDIGEAIDRNYLDCIAPSLYFPQDARLIADIGSGAGFPGIPLAIVLPNAHFVLMDSLTKRVEFLQSVIRELRLDAEAVHIRAEDAAHMDMYRERFDIATARAVAPMNVLCEYLLPFVRVGGFMMALKGPGLDAELADAAHAMDELGGSLDGIDAIDIPDRDWAHRLCRIRKCAPTPEKYPRKAGKVEKKPL